VKSQRAKPSKPHGRLAVDIESGTFLGDTRIRLLEAIGQAGSILQAAKSVPLSYKAAWDAVSAMNNLAEHPLVERTGGGTQLTDYGRRMVAMYRTMEQEYQETLERLWARMGESGAGDVRQFQAMLRRISIKTSARNQFAGPISALRGGEVNFEVCLRLDDANELVATITRESAESMNLRIGMEVHAFVNASSIILAIDRDGRMTARNQLWGTVTHIHDGPVDSEVTLTLAGGRTVTAVVTHDSVGILGLVEGLAVGAMFKSSSVILAALG